MWVIAVVIFVVILILLRKYLSDIIFETIVDGGLSFLDEILGFGFIPGADFGDIIAAFIIYRRYSGTSKKKKHKRKHINKGTGKFVAVFGALEAVNFIVLSFIPGADFFTNIFPTIPFLRLISQWMAVQYPDSEWFNSPGKLAEKSRKKYNKMMNEIKDHDKTLRETRAQLETRNMHEKAIEAADHFKDGEYRQAHEKYEEAIDILKHNTYAQLIEKWQDLMEHRIEDLSDPGFLVYVRNNPNYPLANEKFTLMTKTISEDMQKALDHIHKDEIGKAIEKAGGAIELIEVILSIHEEYAYENS